MFKGTTRSLGILRLTGLLLAAGATLFAHGDMTDEAASCSGHRISARAITTAGDIQAFVRCAAEYVREHGFAEARRAFNEDERWKHGPTYVFVDGVAPSGEQSVTYVFPPEPSREGTVWGSSIDSFGTDYFLELHRVLEVVDAGWLYYAFTNFETGRDEPKSSYVIEIDWEGNRAAIGAGFYGNDQPGTCHPDEVNASVLASEPNDTRLQEFVRCAALMVETEGYFAKNELELNPRWSHGLNTYVYVMDMMGNQLLSSARLRPDDRPYFHEWGGSGTSPEIFSGRNVVAVGDAFGEAFLYYTANHRETGRSGPKVGMLKRIVSQGLPLLVGSGYHLPPNHVPEARSCSDNDITGAAVRTRRDIRALVTCAAEYIAENGTAEAYRAFHDEERWSDPEHYAFVRSIGGTADESMLLAYPPDRTREGITGASLHPVAASLFRDYLQVVHRIADGFGSGWVHYYFIDRQNGTIEPKSSYVVEIDWNGQRAIVGAGIFERDLPGTCHRNQVNAAVLDADPSESRLQEFVRCAAAEVESWGLFAAGALETDDRWRSATTRVFGINSDSGEWVFGSPASGMPFGLIVPAAFGGRDVISVANTFGEAFLYHNSLDRDSGLHGRPRVGFVKRVFAQGIPVLVGASYIEHSEQHPH